MYIMTTRRITSGDELKRRNGEGGSARDLRFMSVRYQPPALPATLVRQSTTAPNLVIASNHITAKPLL